MICGIIGVNKWEAFQKMNDRIFASNPLESLTVCSMFNFLVLNIQLRGSKCTLYWEILDLKMYLVYVE